LKFFGERVHERETRTRANRMPDRIVYTVT
jgi:hypothetical protein